MSWCNVSLLSPLLLLTVNVYKSVIFSRNYTRGGHTLAARQRKKVIQVFAGLFVFLICVLKNPVDAINGKLW